jgi:hypothetical protein
MQEGIQEIVEADSKGKADSGKQTAKENSGTRGSTISATV